MISANYISINNNGIYYNKFYNSLYSEIQIFSLNHMLYENCRIASGTRVVSVWRLFEKFDILNHLFDLSVLKPCPSYDTLPESNDHLSIRWDARCYHDYSNIWNILDIEANIGRLENEGFNEVIEWESFDQLMFSHISTSNVMQIWGPDEAMVSETYMKDLKLFDVLNVFYNQIMKES